MKSIPVSQAFLFLSLFASACVCLTCRAEEQSKEMATKLAEIRQRSFFCNLHYLIFCEPRVHWIYACGRLLVEDGTPLPSYCYRYNSSRPKVAPFVDLWKGITN